MPGGVALEALTAHVGAQVGAPVVLDESWRPAMQGAVGHVVGLRIASGTPCVAKVFREGGDHQAVELEALRLAAGVLGDLSPGVLAHGVVPEAGFGYIVMTRLPGERWADRRPGLDPEQRGLVLTEVARVLTRLHGVTGPRYGSLLDGGRAWPGAADRMRDLAGEVTSAYLSAGGDATLADDVGRLVRSADLVAGVLPVLCHHDLNGGNVLVEPGSVPHVTGVVDFERASWDDPMRDLALTVTHLLHHEPESVPTLLDAYGGLDAASTRRLQVHAALLAMAERTWVVTDRPQAWQQSAARLNDMVRGRLDAADAS